MTGRHRTWTAALIALILSVPTHGLPAHAAPGDADRGEAIYAKRCVLCHGEDGDGDTAAAERLNPPPRDFTEAQYKFKTTGFEDIVPNDQDLVRMIRDGMPGTAMPGWSDMLSEQDIADLVAYIKTFAGLEEEEPSDQLDYGTQVEPSDQGLAAGRELFDDRCGECHGRDGRGDGIKKLKDDAGARTWPRNLTKAWTFRASNQPKDIFTRISVGVPGTQMPSFADPKSKKKLTIEERWHVANYVASLADPDRAARAEDTVIEAERIEGELPSAPDDPRWAASEATTFLVLPQIIAKERLFAPTIDAVTVRAVYGETEIALLVEWDDRTKSIPGDVKAEGLAEAELGEDMVAVQLPTALLAGMEKPYFGMGDPAHPVNLWRWRSGTTDQAEVVQLLNAIGFGETEERDDAAAGLTANGVYDAGTWRVVIKRPLATAEPESDLQFEAGRFTPIAFAIWDGSNGEHGSRHTMTTWYWLLLKPDSGFRPLIAALAVIVLLGAVELWWARSAGQRAARRRAAGAA